MMIQNQLYQLQQEKQQLKDEVARLEDLWKQEQDVEEHPTQPFIIFKSDPKQIVPDVKLYYALFTTQDRRNHGEIEINPERMDIDQAVKEMGRGKDIMTLNKNLAMDVLTRFKDAGKGWGHLKVEVAHQKTDGYYDHLHYGRNGVEERLHCWIWKNT